MIVIGCFWNAHNEENIFYAESFFFELKCHFCLCFSWKAFGFSRKALNFFRYATSSLKSSLSRSNSSSRVNFFSSFFFCLFGRSEEHTSELQSRFDLVCRLLLDRSHVPPVLHSFPTRRSSDLILLL